MPLSPVHHITFDSADPYRSAAFWSEVTGWPVHADCGPEDEEVLLESPGEGIANLLFIRVPEARSGKNRLHLDLRPLDRTRDEEVTRLLGLGASLVADHRRPDGSGWVTLADPEGNELCVERSAAERGR